MTDLESAVRNSLHRRLQLARVPAVQPWDDAHVAEVLAAAVPDGMVTADGPEAAGALLALKERAEGMEALAREMLASFRHNANGYSARVKAEQVEAWRERLGEQE